jgi:hypothetical protein
LEIASKLIGAAVQVGVRKLVVSDNQSNPIAVVRSDLSEPIGDQLVSLKGDPARAPLLKEKLLGSSQDLNVLERAVRELRDACESGDPALAEPLDLLGGETTFIVPPLSVDAVPAAFANQFQLQPFGPT